MGPYDTYIGSGVLGVSVSPFEEEGVVLGELIRRVLAGEKPENIGILPPNPPRLILDDRQVKRWGIKSVPAGAELRFPRRRCGRSIARGHRGDQRGGVAGPADCRAHLRPRPAEAGGKGAAAFRGALFRRLPRQPCGHQHHPPVGRADRRCQSGVGSDHRRARGRDAIGRTPLETGMVIGGDGKSRFQPIPRIRQTAARLRADPAERPTAARAAEPFDRAAHAARRAVLHRRGQGCDRTSRDGGGAPATRPHLTAGHARRNDGVHRARSEPAARCAS